MRHIGFAVAATVLSGSIALAQHSHMPSHGGHAPPAAHGGHAPPEPDTRERVAFPAPMAEHLLANMRDHLAALQEIAEHLGKGHPETAAAIAENRLGMSSLGLHGAEAASKFMPAGMQAAGTAMHRAASRFALTATDAAVTGELKPVFSALSDLTSACVACHAGYKIH